MTWPMLLRRQVFFSALLRGALLAAVAFTLWLTPQSSAEASSSVPLDSGATRIGEAQVDSKVGHTCGTSENPSAGQEIQLVSTVTAREDLEGVYVEFELINTTRGLSDKGNAQEGHRDMNAGESGTFSHNVTLLRQGSNWIVKCTVKAHRRLIVDETVSETKSHGFGVARGSLALAGSEAWLNTCEPNEGWEGRRFSLGERFRVNARGIAKGHLGEGANEKNKFDVHLRLYRDGRKVNEFDGNRTATGDHDLWFYDLITAPQSPGYYAIDCVLISRNSHLDLLERIKNVQSCQSGHFIPVIATCMTTLPLDVKFRWHPVWIISTTICVGDETDCPGTSTGPGTTTTTPPPTGEATPETTPVTPVPVPEPPPAPEPPSSSDRAALIALYNDTGGPRWINNLQDREPWQIGVSDSGIDDWYGVRTHDDGRVKDLLLEFDNNLHGTLPSRLGNLTQTLVLSIKGNERDGRSLQGVHGSIPGELGNLTALQGLYLANNELSGAIPEALGNLAELDTLDLSGNRLTGNIPAALDNLANLQDLDLSGNRLEGEIPAALGNLANLQDLDLSGNRLEGEIPATLGNLANLDSLYLSGESNDFTGCIPSGLRRVDDHDLDELEPPFCDVALSGLTVSPGQLDEPFDSARTSFDATVYQSRITVAATAVEGGSFEILDDDNDLLADADTAASGYQVDLATAEETIRVRIVSSDGRQRRPYTLSLTVEGPSAPGAPAIGAITAQGASLLVPWSAAAGSAASAPTAYNLRHILSGASDKADANWTPSTVSASPGSSAVSYWLQDLEPSTAYDVQAQAVNDAGSSPWSASVSATTGAAIRIRWITCAPSRPLPGATVSCTPSVTGGVRTDDSYAWLAAEGTPSTASTRTLQTSWDSKGSKRVVVEACSAGDCASLERTIAVADPNPNFIWDHTQPPAEIALGDSIDLGFEMIKLGVTGTSGGVFVSFPPLTDRDSGGNSLSYESAQGIVETIASLGSGSTVAYRDSGSDQSLQNEDGTQGAPRHLVVAAETSAWPRSFFLPPSRTLKLRVTPRVTGQFRILYRYWLCTSDRQNCVHSPVQDGESVPLADQQGWAAFELTVNVLATPVIDSISCTPDPAQIGNNVDCSPVLSGGTPSSYAWNAGNALAGGTPFEGSDATIATVWDYSGQQRVTLKVCNVAGCDTGEQFVAVGAATTTIPETGGPEPVTEPVAVPEALAVDDGGRVLYSGPASAKAKKGYSPTDTTLHVKVLPTSPMPTLQVAILDDDGFAAGSSPYTSAGALVLALPHEAWVDYHGITVEQYAGNAWAPYTSGVEHTLLALERLVGAVQRTATTAGGIAPAASGEALTAADRLAWAIGQADSLPLDDIFQKRHANCVSQLAVPWLAWAGQTKGVRVSIPLSMPADSYASLAAAFTAAEPGATDGSETALAQLQDLLGTGEDAPVCRPPGALAQ